MGITVTRSGDQGQNFTQTSQGETFNNITVSMNAKGQAQVEVKLCFSSPDEMEREAGAQLARIYREVRLRLSETGISLAGEK